MAVSASSIRMGQGYVELGVNDGPLVAGLNAAKSKFEAWGKSIGALGASMARTGGLIVAAFSPSVAIFANYEQALANLRAAANPTTEEFARLRTTIEAVGKATGTDFSEVTTAFGELVKAGRSVDEVVSGLGLALVQFSRVSEMTAPEAVLTLTGAMNVFSAEGLNATQVMNYMSQAAETSRINLRQVSEAFTAGGSTAARYNQSMRDTATAISLMGDAQVEGADAGTSLRRVLMNLAGDGEPIADSLSAIGLSLDSFRDSAGRLLPVVEIIRTLETALGRLGERERSSAITGIGGMYGSAGLSALLRTGTAGFEARQTAMAQSLTVEQKFAMMNETLLGSLKKVWVSVQDIAVAVGEALQPALAATGKVLLPVLNLVAEFARRNQTAIQIIAAVGVVLLAVGGGLLAFGLAMSVVGAAFGSLATIASAAATSFAWLPTLILWSDYARYSILGLTGVFRAFGVEMRDIWEPLGVIDDLFDSLMDTLAGLASGTIFAEMGESIKRMWAALMDSPVGEFIKTIALVVVGIATINTLLISLAGYLAYLGMANSFDMLAQGIRAVMPILETLFSLWLQGVGYISQAFATLFDPLIRLGRGTISTIQSVYNAAAQAFSTAWATTVAEFGRLIEGLTATASQAWGGIVAAFNVGDWQGIWDIIQITVRLAWAQIQGFIEPTFNAWRDALVDAFRGAVLAIKSAFITLWGGIKAEAFDSMARIARGMAALAIGPARTALEASASVFDTMAGSARTDAETSVANLTSKNETETAGLAETRRQRDEAARTGNASEVARLQAELDQLLEAQAFDQEIRRLEELDAATFGTPSVTSPAPGGDIVANAISGNLIMGGFGRNAMNVLGASTAQTPEERAARQREAHLTELRNIAERIAELREEIAPRAT